MLQPADNFSIKLPTCKRVYTLSLFSGIAELWTRHEEKKEKSSLSADECNFRRSSYVKSSVRLALSRSRLRLRKIINLPRAPSKWLSFDAHVHVLARIILFCFLFVVKKIRFPMKQNLNHRQTCWMHLRNIIGGTSTALFGLFCMGNV